MWPKCNTKRVGHGKKSRLQKGQREKSDKNEIWKKSAQEWCTRMQNWITGCLLMNRYALVFAVTVSSRGLKFEVACLVLSVIDSKHEYMYQEHIFWYFFKNYMWILKL